MLLACSVSTKLVLCYVFLLTLERRTAKYISEEFQSRETMTPVSSIEICPKLATVYLARFVLFLSFVGGRIGCKNNTIFHCLLSKAMQLPP